MQVQSAADVGQGVDEMEKTAVDDVNLASSQDEVDVTQNRLPGVAEVGLESFSAVNHVANEVAAAGVVVSRGSPGVASFSAVSASA